MYQFKLQDPWRYFSDAVRLFASEKGTQSCVRIVCEDDVVTVSKIRFQLFSPLVSQLLKTCDSVACVYSCDGHVTTIHVPDVKANSISHLANILDRGYTNINGEGSEILRKIIEAAGYLGVNLKNFSFELKTVTTVRLQDWQGDPNNNDDISSEASDLDLNEEKELLIDIKSDVEVNIEDDMKDEADIKNEDDKNKVNFMQFSSDVSLASNICSECGVQLSSQRILREHISAVHLNEKHPCKDCDRVFPWKTSLRRHIGSVHKGIKFNCTFCNFSTTRKYALKQHIESKHNTVN